MPDNKASDQLSERDRLVTRPDEPLPTPLDPASPEARGEPADPKPEDSQVGRPRADKEEVERSV